MGSAARPIGNGEPVTFEFHIESAFAGGTSTNFQIISSAAAGLGTPTILGETGVVLTAAITAGKKFRVTVPAGTPILRYIGAQFTINGTNSGGGAVSCYIAPVVDEQEVYQGVV